MLILPHSLGVQKQEPRNCGAAAAGASWSHDVHSREAERDGCWYSAHFLLFIGPQDSEMGFPPPLILSGNILVDTPS